MNRHKPQSRPDSGSDARKISELIRKQAADIAQALAHPHRVRLLMSLAQCPKAVERLADEIGISIASASAHLKVLQRVRLVICERVGRFMVNQIADDSIFELLVVLRRMVERHSPAVREAVRSFELETASQSMRGTTEELCKAIANPALSLVDVRQSDEYAFGHLPRAISVPFQTLAVGMKTLPKRKRIAAYCRGPNCATADAAVRQMRDSGLNAFHLSLDVLEWRAAGLELVVEKHLDA